ncbi:dienelactone hydrolase family protein [Longispora albida]|uniref:dienelactone hydrolase family protein n=1 Tax=Longispora albida TaxID=203523 RepID=UPI000364E722|nr:dienelactone hydrolase family protein [Longispora albida]
MCVTETTEPGPARDLIELTATDGTAFSAYLAEAADPTGAQLIVLPDNGGLRPFYQQLARRFTETGADTLVIDYYSRTAGTAGRPDDYNPVQDWAEFSRVNVLADLQAAVAYTRARSTGPVYVAGFCVGGANALWAGTLGLGLAGVIGVCPYVGNAGRDAALPDDFATAITSPVLGLFGGDDHAVPLDVPEAIERSLKATGQPHDIVVYPGQPHGFIEKDFRGQAGHEEAAGDAWQRITRFLAN